MIHSKGLAVEVCGELRLAGSGPSPSRCAFAAEVNSFKDLGDG